MRILITSYVFLPGIGGIEVMTDCLARAFQAEGHEVEVATMTPAEGTETVGYAVLRQPSVGALLRAAKRSDVVLQNGFSLRLLLPVLTATRPVAVVHQTWLSERWQSGARGWLQYWALNRVRNLAISEPIADHLPGPRKVIPNAYREGVFRDLGMTARRTDICCAARLVSDKGVDLFIAALVQLSEEDLRPSVTIVGDGPERSALERKTQSAGLSDRVHVVGSLSGRELSAALNDSRILVVPSRFREPFGIVALEGAACGCYVVGADGGGLAEAIGPCGETFARGSTAALSAALERLLTQGLPARDPARVAAHLTAHGEARIAELYLRELEDLAGPGA